MKAKSFSGIVLYVNDPAKSVKFYETIGFTATEQSDAQASMRLNWFWIDVHSQAAEDKEEFKADATASNKGAGAYFYLSVDDVDEAYKDIVAAGYKPSSEPHDWPWGNREFVVRDPDGYKLVIFKRNKKRNPAE